MIWFDSRSISMEIVFIWIIYNVQGVINKEVNNYIRNSLGSFRKTMISMNIMAIRQLYFWTAAVYLEIDDNAIWFSLSLFHWCSLLEIIIVSAELWFLIWFFKWLSELCTHQYTILAQTSDSLVFLLVFGSLVKCPNDLS